MFRCCLHCQLLNNRTSDSAAPGKAPRAAGGPGCSSAFSRAVAPEDRGARSVRSRRVGRRKRDPIRRVPRSDTASLYPMGLQVGCQPFPRLIWLLFKSKQCFLVALCLFYSVQRAQVRPIDCSHNFYSCYIGSLSSGPQAQNQLPCPNEPQYLINVDKAGQIKTRQNSSGFEPPRGSRSWHRKREIVML